MTDDSEIPKWVQTIQRLSFEIGLVANEWAKLEHFLVPLAKILLRTTDFNVAKAVMFSMNPPQKRDLIKALAQLSPLTETEKNAVDNCMNEFERLRVLRNDIVHGHWGALTEEGNPILRLVKARSLLRDTSEPKDLNWIGTTTRDIQTLQGEIVRLTRAISGLYPSRQISQQQ